MAKSRASRKVKKKAAPKKKRIRKSRKPFASTRSPDGRFPI